MNKQKTLSLKFAQQGVVVIEAMIAILIFSIGVLGIVGLQAAMIKNTAESKYRADANYLAQQMIGQLWADPLNRAAYPGITVDSTLNALPDGTLFDISSLPGGSLSIASADQINFTVTVTWPNKEDPPHPHNYTTTATIAGG